MFHGWKLQPGEEDKSLDPLMVTVENGYLSLAFDDASYRLTRLLATYCAGHARAFETLRFAIGDENENSDLYWCLQF